MQRRVVLIEKLMGHDDDAGVVYRYFIRPGSVRRRWIWFNPDEVPPFEGARAEFEVEQVRGVWRVVRLVDRSSDVRFAPPRQ